MVWVAPTVRVSVVEPEPLTDPGLKLAVVAAGTPEMLKVTVPVNPFAGVTVIKSVPAVPCWTMSCDAAALSEKSALATAFTVSETCAVCWRLPLVPVMVSV